MSANTHTAMGQKLAQALYALLTHPRIGDWEQRARILLNLRPPPDGYLPLIYTHVRPQQPLFGGLTREEALIRLHRTHSWRQHFPDPTPAAAFKMLINRRARDFIAKYPAHTLADLAEQLTAMDLLAEPGIGEITVLEIRTTLHKYGYELRDF